KIADAGTKWSQDFVVEVVHPKSPLVRKTVVASPARRRPAHRCVASSACTAIAWRTPAARWIWVCRIRPARRSQMVGEWFSFPEPNIEKNIQVSRPFHPIGRWPASTKSACLVFAFLVRCLDFRDWHHCRCRGGFFPTERDGLP